MWLDVKAALLEIEGGTPAIPAIPANLANLAIREAKSPQNEGGIAEIARIAAPHGDNSLFIKTDNIKFQEREAIVANNGAPEEWVTGYATLVSLPYPENWTQQKWDQVLINTEKFLDEWGAQAHRLGWSVNDLFGISQSGSVARLDCLGLVHFFDTANVTHMTDKTAILQCLNERTGEPNGSTLRFYRKNNMSGSVPIWEIQTNKTER